MQHIQIPYPRGRWEVRSRLLSVMDFETDPFNKGKAVFPFVLGVYDGLNYSSTWSHKCVKQFIEWLQRQPPMMIYAHNGGNFDFMFLREYWAGEPTIINGRIVEFDIGIHKFRDSFKIMPVALKRLGAKSDIDYQKMNKRERQKHKPEILSYLQQDCIVLYDAIRKFIDKFGMHLTIGGAAIKELQRHHSYDRIIMGADRYLREYFYGGRNQCFETGVRTGDFHVYDVNSMYPYVMAHCKHPVSADIDEGRTITKHTAFIHLEAKNYGALPFRAKDGSLDFTVEKGEFFTTIHEYNAGLETGTLEPLRIISVKNFFRWADFSEFVYKFYALRVEAGECRNLLDKELYKLILTNSYGKFAQDYRNFRDYAITDQVLPQCKLKCIEQEKHCGKCWELTAQLHGKQHLWEKPVRPFPHNFHNIATGASITGAARAYLLRGIAKATRPVYCDTDSIICEQLDMPTHATQLGSWKHEARGNKITIAGKKTYALFDGTDCIKKASKGALLTGEQIERIAMGEEIEYAQEAPKFKLSGEQVPIIRKIRRTG